MKKILFLSMEDVVRCGGSNILLAAEDVYQGFQLLDQKRLLSPMKTTLKPSHRQQGLSEGLVNILPAYIDLGEEKGEVYGLKALGAMPSNVEKNIPRATGLITLFDGPTKSPLCVMDAQVISATRTGAVSHLAAKKLVDPTVDEVGLVGAGVNMRTQLLGLKKALPKLKQVDVYSRGESKFKFAKEMEKLVELTINPVDSAEKAVSNKRLIVTCLPNILSPVVKEEWVYKEGITHFNIGCYESETSILKWMDRVVADVWEQGKHRGIQTHAQAVKQGVIPEEKIEDLAPILLEKVEGRRSSQDNIFFAPTGLGFSDLMVAYRVYKEAITMGVGTSLTLWQDCQWI